MEKKNYNYYTETNTLYTLSKNILSNTLLITLNSINYNIKIWKNLNLKHITKPMDHNITIIFNVKMKSATHYWILISLKLIII